MKKWMKSEAGSWVLSARMFEDPLVVGACAGRGAAFVEASWRASGARFQGAVGVVDAVDCGADVGGQLAWADVPVDDFGDAVAESAG